MFFHAVVMYAASLEKAKNEFQMFATNAYRRKIRGKLYLKTM